MLIDLSHTLKPKVPVYPNDTPLALTKSHSLETDGYTSYTLESGMHVATHIDAPMHMVNSNKTIDEFPLENFCGKGILLDVRGKSIIEMHPSYKDLTGDILLLYTGYDQYFNEPKKYFHSHPTITLELANFCITKKFKMIGMDTPSPDKPPFEIHKLLLSNGIFIIENLTNLGKLSNLTTFEIFALPLKIQAEASFSRVFALCP